MKALTNINPLSRYEGNSNSLNDQLRLHLDGVLAQELAKLVGEDNFDRIIQSRSKVNSAQSDSANQILEKMKEMGIKLDNNLINLVKNEPSSVVIDAFEAYKEAFILERVKCGESFLKAAIKNRYIPNYRKKAVV